MKPGSSDIIRTQLESFAFGEDASSDMSGYGYVCPSGKAGVRTLEHFTLKHHTHLNYCFKQMAAEAN